MNKTGIPIEHFSDSDEGSNSDEPTSNNSSQKSSVPGSEEWTKKLSYPSPGSIEVLGMTQATDDKSPPMLPLVALPSVPLSDNHQVSLDHMKNLVRFCQKLAQWNKGQLTNDSEIDTVMYQLSNSERIGHKRPRS